MNENFIPNFKKIVEQNLDIYKNSQPDLFKKDKTRRWYITSMTHKQLLVLAPTVVLTRCEETEIEDPDSEFTGFANSDSKLCESEVKLGKQNITWKVKEIKNLIETKDPGIPFTHVRSQAVDKLKVMAREREKEIERQNQKSKKKRGRKRKEPVSTEQPSTSTTNMPLQPSEEVLTLSPFDNLESEISPHTKPIDDKNVDNKKRHTINLRARKEVMSASYYDAVESPPKKRNKSKQSCSSNSVLKNLPKEFFQIDVLPESACRSEININFPAIKPTSKYRLFINLEKINIDEACSIIKSPPKKQKNPANQSEIAHYFKHFSCGCENQNCDGRCGSPINDNNSMMPSISFGYQSSGSNTDDIVQPKHNSGIQNSDGRCGSPINNNDSMMSAISVGDQSSRPNTSDILIVQPKQNSGIGNIISMDSSDVIIDDSARQLLCSQLEKNPGLVQPASNDTGLNTNIALAGPLTTIDGTHMDDLVFPLDMDSNAYRLLDYLENGGNMMNQTDTNQQTTQSESVVCTPNSNNINNINNTPEKTTMQQSNKSVDNTKENFRKTPSPAQVDMMSVPGVKISPLPELCENRNQAQFNKNTEKTTMQQSNKSVNNTKENFRKTPSPAQVDMMSVPGVKISHLPELCENRNQAHFNKNTEKTTMQQSNKSVNNTKENFPKTPSPAQIDMMSVPGVKISPLPELCENRNQAHFNKNTEKTTMQQSNKSVNYTKEHFPKTPSPAQIDMMSVPGVKISPLPELCENRNQAHFNKNTEKTTMQQSNKSVNNTKENFRKTPSPAQIDMMSVPGVKISPLPELCENRNQAHFKKNTENTTMQQSNKSVNNTNENFPKTPSPAQIDMMSVPGVKISPLPELCENRNQAHSNNNTPRHRSSFVSDDVIDLSLQKTNSDTFWRSDSVLDLTVSSSYPESNDKEHESVTKSDKNLKDLSEKTPQTLGNENIQRISLEEYQRRHENTEKTVPQSLEEITTNKHKGAKNCDTNCLACENVRILNNPLEEYDFDKHSSNSGQQSFAANQAGPSYSNYAYQSPATKDSGIESEDCGDKTAEKNSNVILKGNSTPIKSREEESLKVFDEIEDDTLSIFFNSNVGSPFYFSEYGDTRVEDANGCKSICENRDELMTPSPPTENCNINKTTATADIQLNGITDGSSDYKKVFKIPKLLNFPLKPCTVQNTSVLNDLESNLLFPECSTSQTMSFEPYKKPENCPFTNHASGQSVETYINNRRNTIDDVFGHRPCFMYLEGKCQKPNCKFSHEIIDCNVLRHRLTNLNYATLCSGYNFISRNRPLFRIYFTPFCHEFAHRGDRKKLTSMIRDVQVYQENLYCLRLIAEALGNTGMSRVDAVKTIRENFNSITTEAMDIMVDLMIDSDVTQFVSTLMSYVENPRYKFKREAVEKLAYKCNRTKHSGVSQLLIRIIYYDSQNPKITKDDEQCPEFVKFLDIVRNSNMNIGQNVYGNNNTLDRTCHELFPPGASSSSSRNTLPSMPSLGPSSSSTSSTLMSNFMKRY